MCVCIYLVVIYSDDVRSGGNTCEENKREDDGSRMCAVIREDRISNARIRGTVKMAEVWNKTQEARLRWYGHIMRSNGERREEDPRQYGKIA